MEETNEQVRLTLRSIRDALRADIVCWEPGSGSGGPAHVSLGHTPPSGWCSRLLARLVELARDQDQQCWADAGPLHLDLSPAPVSLALSRISRSRGSWLLAASLNPACRFDDCDLRIMSLARRLLLNHRVNLSARERLRETLFGVVRCLTAAIDAKDPYTCGHSERVARIGRRIGRQMGMSDSQLSDIYLAGLLHDIGKIGVRDETLKKPGELTFEELEHIRRHTLLGDRMISTIRQLSHLRPGVRSHHERFDGEGYPDALAGERIPLMARVLAVADSCDAMMSDRPYRRALPPERIDIIMNDGAGRQWDPDVVAHFMACRQELYLIFQRGLGESVVAAVAQSLDTDRDDMSRLGPRRISHVDAGPLPSK
jgi:HD-GYP domain-containing protein (c-di-GMP phosphodiesterase class II)